MTDLTTPGEINAAADNAGTGHGITKASTPYIVDGVDIAGLYSGITTGNLNAFAYNSGASTGLDAVFDGGEAWIYGHIMRDTQTTVTLPDDATTTVYLGYDVSAIVDTGVGEDPTDVENVILGLDADFGTGDPQVPLYDMETQSGSIVDATRRCRVGPMWNDEGALLEPITTTLDGFVDAPLKINDRTAYAEFDAWATVYSNGGVGWRFRNGSEGDDHFWVDQNTEAAGFDPRYDVQYRVENRTTDPASPADGREWLRTDL